MANDLYATTAWQTTAELTEATLFQAKVERVRVTDTDPAGDLEAGLVLEPGFAHVYPTGKTIRYRSEFALTADAGAAAELKVRLAVQSAG